MGRIPHLIKRFVECCFGVGRSGWRRDGIVHGIVPSKAGIFVTSDQPRIIVFKIVQRQGMVAGIIVKVGHGLNVILFISFFLLRE